MPRQLRTRAQLTEASKPPRQAMSDRPHRAVTKQQKDPDSSPLSTITVARESSSSPVAGRKSIKLTLKMAPSKLREVTMGSTARSTSTVSRDSLEPSTRASGPRASRAKRAVVIDSGSDGDDDEEEEEDESDDEQSDVDDEGVIAQREEDDAGEDEERGEEDDAEGEEDEDEEEEEGEEEEEEEEEEDADGDADVDMEDMDAAPPPPVIQRIGPSSNPKLMVTPAPTKGHIRSVEAKEIQMANDAASDEDLSELPDDEDAEGEDVAEDEAMVDADEDAEGDSDDDLSRDGTPDMTKLTKRQRARIGEEGSEHFMSLNMEPQTKLHLTDEQRALRRAEMARRRKNLSEKRNEEEKMDTINRLLKKQAPKRRGKVSTTEPTGGAETPDIQMNQQEEPEVAADPAFIRWVSNADGYRVGIPVEWQGKASASVFGPGKWRVIEEIEA